MTKLFLAFLALFLMIGLVFAQPPEGTWEFDSLVVCGYTIGTDYGQAAVNIPAFRIPYSVTLDPDGKIWFGSYYERRDEFTDEYVDRMYTTAPADTYNCQPIFVFDPATSELDTLKILDLPDGSSDTLVSRHYGMCTDHQGNIIVNLSNGEIYKINYQTKEVIANRGTGESSARPAVDADGYVYQPNGVLMTRIDILDPADWSAPYNTIANISASVTRVMDVSPNGQNVYICSYNGGLVHYYSADGVNGTYTVVDTILPKVIIGPDTLTFEANYCEWHPSGLIWVATREEANPKAMYALDPDQDYMIVDSLKEFVWWGNTDQTDTTTGGYAQPKYVRAPRDGYFNAAGNEFYLADMYSYGIKKYKFTPSTGIQPGQDSKVVPGIFTLYHSYPNPFNPTTTIPFELHKRAHVILRVYDSLGRLVGTYYDKPLNTGLHEFTFDARDLASGQYYFKLTVDRSVATGKMLLLK